MPSMAMGPKLVTAETYIRYTDGTGHRQIQRDGCIAAELSVAKSIVADVLSAVADRTDLEISAEYPGVSA